MQLLERLEICKKCDNREYSKTGIICSLTNEKPNFEDKCSEFKIDPREIAKQQAKEKYKNIENDNSKMPSFKTAVWTLIIVILIIFKIIRLIKF